MLRSARPGRTGPRPESYGFAARNLTGKFTVLPALHRASSHFQHPRSRCRPEQPGGAARWAWHCSRRIRALGEALEDVFGWELLQIGAWGGGARAACRQPHAPSDRDCAADVPRRRGHHRRVRRNYRSTAMRRCGAAASHARIRGRSLRHRARGGSRAGGRGPAAGARLSAVEPVGHARAR